MRTVRALLTLLVLIAAACGDNTAPPRPEVVSSRSVIQQDGVVGELVPIAPAVIVTTAGGQPVGGVAVSFAITAGGGSLPTVTVKTDASGIATVSDWTLGTLPVANTLVASVAGIAGTVLFSVQARPAPVARLVPITTVTGVAQSGVALPALTVELRDRFDNLATTSELAVTASLAAGTGQLDGVMTVHSVLGRATFSSLVINGDGAFRLRFAAQGVDEAVSDPFNVTTPVECAAPKQQLDFALGQMMRYQLSGTQLDCLYYDHARDAGRQYLLLFENMPLSGGYSSGLFSGVQADSTFPLRVRSGSASPAAVPPRVGPAPAPPRAVHAWDFGSGPIYEIEPEPPPAGTVLAPRLLRANGQLVDLNSVDPVVGDTLVVRLEGIGRLGIPTGNQKVVVRYVSPQLVITEDARLATLTRTTGAVNTPLTQAQLAAIAQEYAALARVEGDKLFEGRHNDFTEANNGGRVVAVHSLMSSDNVWGYTYSTGNYFVWDFWVGTNGSTAGLSQQPQRVADNLFMHEIAHMRHAGLILRSGLTWTNPDRGNQWLVEGFARFTERLPIAVRLLATAEPSRVDNLRLPLNPAFNNSYFRDDVPTFLNAGTVMFDAYHNSSYVFDYFADQVAATNGDWRAALRDLLLAGGREPTLDAAVARWLPGLTFAELFTRARIALYTDDIGWALPPWTQYLQYQLRLSRPSGSQTANDPRNLWPQLTPGTAFDIAPPGGAIYRGAAYGVVIDGTATTAASGTIVVDAPRKPNVVMSITRIR